MFGLYMDSGLQSCQKSGFHRTYTRYLLYSEAVSVPVLLDASWVKWMFEWFLEYSNRLLGIMVWGVDRGTLNVAPLIDDTSSPSVLLI